MNLALLRIGLGLLLSVTMLVTGAVAHARIIYSTEEGVTNANTFIIDFDDSAGDDSTDIVLQFGDTLPASITYDISNDWFEVSDDVNFLNNQAINMALHSGTTTAAVTGPVEGQIFWDSDDDIIYVYDTTLPAWIPIGSNATTLNNLTSNQFLRSDATDNYETGTLTFDNGTTLTGAAGSTINFDASSVNINGIDNPTFILNEDGTGTEDVVLQFGGTLAETLTFDQSAGEFVLSDDLSVTGNVNATGSFNQDGDTITLNADADGDSNVSIIASQNTTGETGILRYNATTNQWEISNDNGVTYSAVVDEDSVQTITNKTIDGDDNTIQDVDFASLKTRSKSDTVAPEFPNVSLVADGTNNKGILSGERDDTSDRNYYSWESKSLILNDYSLLMEWYIPEDWTAWEGPVSMEIDLRTEEATSAADNAIDIVVRNASDVVVTSATGQTSDVDDTWKTISLDLTGGTFNAGELVTTEITLYSRRDNGGGAGDQRHAQVSDVRFNYIGR